jgi:hypothetical protein
VALRIPSSTFAESGKTIDVQARFIAGSEWRRRACCRTISLFLWISRCTRLAVTTSGLETGRSTLIPTVGNIRRPIMATKLISRWLSHAWSVFLSSRLRAELGEVPERLRRDAAVEKETSPRFPPARTPVARSNHRPADRAGSPLPGFLAKSPFEPPVIGVL